MTDNVYRTALLSLFVQFVIGASTAVGLFLPAANNDVQIILALEVGSQVVEFLWYVVAVCRFRKILTWTRYIDWFLSTPVMLVSTGMFFLLRRDENVMDVFGRGDMWICLAFNWLMLSLGLLLEVRFASRFVGVGLGGLSLVASFTFLGRLIGEGDDPWSLGLYYGVYAVWFLYGVAALFPYEPKNIMYNVLDVISKNGYGVVLLVYTATSR